MWKQTDWKLLYAAAVLESNRVELERRARQCKNAILNRLEQLGDNPNYPAERLEIATACAALLKLETDTLGWPASLGERAP